VYARWARAPAKSRAVRASYGRGNTTGLRLPSLSTVRTPEKKSSFESGAV